MKTHRTTFTLPTALYKDISYVASRMGISQSALVTNVIGDSITHLSAILATIIDHPNEDAIRRMKGQSIDRIESDYRLFLEQVFPKDGLDG